MAIPNEFTRMEMASVKIGPARMRVIVYEAHGLVWGQCLDRDILACGCRLVALLDRLTLTIEAECALRGLDGLSDIAPAPPEWQRLWARTLH